MNKHDIQSVMCGHLHIQYIMDQDLRSGWRYWYIPKFDHKRWHLMNNCTIKEVSYMECHQGWRYSTQIVASTCPIMRIKVLKLNMMGHCLIIGHWWISLRDVRYPINNNNGNQRIECNQTSVNICVEVKNLRESIDQGKLVYSKNCRWRENLPLMIASLKALNGI